MHFRDKFNPSWIQEYTMSFFGQNTPTIAAIVAMAENRVIGINNQLPWHLPADLRHFKELTTGHAILMGRKTHESIGMPLPNRLNLIMSRDPAYTAEGCTTVTSLDEALTEAAKHNHTQLFVIGGAEIYQLLMPQINQLHLTIVHQQVKGDALFPSIDQRQWKEIDKVRHEADEKNPIAYSFVTLKKSSSSR
jgi:dihydrofolate reductase